MRLREILNNASKYTVTESRSVVTKGQVAMWQKVTERQDLERAQSLRGDRSIH